MIVYVKHFFGYSLGSPVVQVNIDSSTSVKQFIGLIIEQIPLLADIIQKNPAIINLYALPYNRMSESERLCIDYNLKHESNIYLAPKMGNIIIQSIADYKNILDYQ